MSECCGDPSSSVQRCPSCQESGPIVGPASVRPHAPDVTEGPWQHCATDSCSVVFYLDTAIIHTNDVITQVGRKASRQPAPVCFCFAHTADDLLADAASNDGISTIKSTIKQAVAEGHCSCEHLNPSTKCCLTDIHRLLEAASTSPVD